MNIIMTVVFLAGAFLIGGIPFGFLIGKCKGIDIRTQGSCNIGATNVTRVVGKWWGKLCFFLDCLKGVLPVAVVKYCVSSGCFSDPCGIVIVLTAFAVVAGHIWPVYLKFKGGKGISTAAGALAVLCWPAVLLAGLCWVIVFFAGRYVSLASIAAAVVLPVSALVLRLTGLQADLPWSTVILMFLLGALAIFKHRSNISRLIAGTENRFEKGKK